MDRSGTPDSASSSDPSRPVTRRRTAFWIAATIVVIAVAALAAGGARAVPPWLTGKIERIVSDTLGRELRLDGPLEISLGTEPTLVAKGVTLANAAWGSEAAMVRVDRVELTLSLRSLWSPPIRVLNLDLEGVRVLLEADEGGRRNWVFEIKKPSGEAPAASRPPVTFDRARVRDFRLTYRGGPRVPPQEVAVERLAARLEPTTGMIRLDAAGAYNGTPWDLAGMLGTLDGLYALRDVEHEVSGHVGNASISLSGRIRDPLALGDPNLAVEIEGPEVASALEVVGIRSRLSGPFHLKARLSPSKDGVGVEAAAGIASVEGTARGRVSSLLKPEDVEAEVTASGPDASIVGSWSGIAGVPRAPFSVTGAVRSGEARWKLSGVKVRVGGTTVAADGAIGTRSRGAGTDLVVAGSGRDLAALSGLTRLRLPEGPFTLHGRLLVGGDGLAIRDVALETAGARVHASGTIGKPPACDALDLTAEASGADLSLLSGIAATPLPRAAFSVHGRVSRHPGAFELDRVEGRLADDTVTVSGRVVPAAGLAGTDLHMAAAGPDLGATARLFSLPELPAVRFDVAGRVRIGPDGYRLEDVTARAGEISARVTGHLARRPLDGGSALDARVQGGALSELREWGVPASLPDEPFTITGRAHTDAGMTVLDDVSAEAGGDRVHADGMLGRLPDTSSLDLRVEAAGPDARRLGRFLGDIDRTALEHVPTERYEISGRVRRLPGAVAMSGGRIALGNAVLQVDGTIGTTPGLHGTELRISGRAPDTAIVAAVAGVSLPEGAIALDGGIAVGASGIRLDAVTASIGDTRAGISGILGPRPDRAGTALDVTLAGADLDDVIGPVTGISPLPPDPFELSAHVTSDPGRVSVSGLAARLGETDIEGSLALAHDGRAVLDANLRSEHVSVAKMLDGFLKAPAENAPESAAPPKKKKGKRKGERLIPDDPLTLDVLGRFDATLRWSVAELALPAMTVRDVAVEGTVRDGALRIDRIDGTGRNGGRMSGALSIEPAATGYSLRAVAGLADGRLDLSKGKAESATLPALDIELEVAGTGRSLREIAAGANGHGLLRLGPGQLPNVLGDLVTSDVLLGLLDALNPFRKSTPYTGVECAVAAAEIQGGKAAVEPIAVRTDKLTIVGKGKVDFSTEGIDLVWTLKPRKGVGISAASIANPYVKLGGTLAAPSMEAKPLEAITSNGAAVATAGLTLLFRGIYDRITAEKKVCVKALEKAQKNAETRASAKGP